VIGELIIKHLEKNIPNGCRMTPILHAAWNARHAVVPLDVLRSYILVQGRSLVAVTAVTREPGVSICTQDHPTDTIVRPNGLVRVQWTEGMRGHDRVRSDSRCTRSQLTFSVIRMWPKVLLGSSISTTLPFDDSP
jgi:hypothetical protein